MNDVKTINKKKIRMFKGEFMKARDRAYSHEEISRILNVSDLTIKVIILFMASTGMRGWCTTISEIKKFRKD
jgi:integrase